MAKSSDFAANQLFDIFCHGVYNKENTKRREINYECDEEGYYTHYYDRDQYGMQEYFAGENHELVKYIENDKVYEGDAISADIVNVFKQMQDMAAEVAYNMINGI